MKCSICGNEIEVNCFGWDQGHNADPVNGERCCDRCAQSWAAEKALCLQEVEAEAEVFDNTPLDNTP